MEEGFVKAVVLFSPTDIVLDAVLLHLYKLFMYDTGLLSNLCLKNLQFQVLNGELDINEGALTENFVAAELAKKELH